MPDGFPEPSMLETVMLSGIVAGVPGLASCDTPDGPRGVVLAVWASLEHAAAAVAMMRQNAILPVRISNLLERVRGAAGHVLVPEYNVRQGQPVRGRPL